MFYLILISIVQLAGTDKRIAVSKKVFPPKGGCAGAPNYTLVNTKVPTNTDRTQNAERKRT
jgi:hypothetical protein